MQHKIDETLNVLLKLNCLGLLLCPIKSLRGANSANHNKYIQLGILYLLFWESKITITITKNELENI